MMEYDTQALNGQERVGKDAAFQCPAVMQGISSGEHDRCGPIPFMRKSDEMPQFAQDAVADAGLQASSRARCERTGLDSIIHQREPGTIGMHGTGPHAPARGDGPALINAVRIHVIVCDARA